MKIKTIFYLIQFHLYRAWHNVKYNSAREHHHKNAKTSSDSYLDLSLTILIKTFEFHLARPTPLNDFLEFLVGLSLFYEVPSLVRNTKPVSREAMLLNGFQLVRQ